MLECYVFDTEEAALSAENDITMTGGAPITNTNAATGEPDPDAQKTIRWAIPEQRVTDGKWFFPRVPADIIASFPAEDVQAFIKGHTFSIEEFKPSWRKQEGV